MAEQMLNYLFATVFLLTGYCFGYAHGKVNGRKKALSLMRRSLSRAKERIGSYEGGDSDD